MKVAWKTVYWNLFLLFIVNAIFFSFLDVAYVCSFPFEQEFKMDAYIVEKPVTFSQKMFFLLLIFWDEGHLYANYLFYIPIFYCKYLLFKVLS